MSKAVQALLSGMFFTFLLDFFLFLGIFQNYIRANDINVYYNILFADNQSLILFVLLSVILGYLLIYQNAKLALVVIGTLSILSLSTLIAPIGNMLGEVMFMKKDVTLSSKGFTYKGDILYNGRTTINLYDYKFEKIINLEKNKIIGEQ